MSETERRPERTEHEPVYVIVGASGGIGAELTRLLARSGARLLLAARGEERLRELADEVGATALAADARERDAVSALFDRAEEEHGRVDGVANLAGTLLLKPAHVTSDEELRETLEINLWSAFHVVREAARRMRREGGSVVLMSTAAVRLGLPNHEAIAAAKGGVEGLMRSAAATYAGQGLRVNAVAPGLVETPLTARITGSEAALRASESMHALGRVGEPQEVARAVAWLLDREQSWITGQVLGVDGGLSSVKPKEKAG